MCLVDYFFLNKQTFFAGHSFLYNHKFWMHSLINALLQLDIITLPDDEEDVTLPVQANSRAFSVSPSHRDRTIRLLQAESGPIVGHCLPPPIKNLGYHKLQNKGELQNKLFGSHGEDLKGFLRGEAHTHVSSLQMWNRLQGKGNGPNGIRSIA